jgi:hypothetical protein
MLHNVAGMSVTSKSYNLPKNIINDVKNSNFRCNEYVCGYIASKFFHFCYFIGDRG